MNLDTVLEVVFLAAGLLIGLTFHEFSHALVADRLGDPTAKMMGRLTLNPVPHIDPFGTVVLPALLLLPVLFGRLTFPVFAYAKPTPMNPANLKDPDRQTMWIALAGPVSNLILAFVFGLVFRLAASTGASGRFAQFLGAVIFVNAILAVFNILPIPPLDGSKVIARFLPPRAREVYRSMEQYGALFILLIFFIIPGPIFALIDPVRSGICELVSGIRC
jgi:Zn-dependent protease